MLGSRLGVYLATTRRVLLVLEALSQNPAPVPEYDVRKLAGMHDTYRIRIGEIRIEYEVELGIQNDCRSRCRVQRKGLQMMGSNILS